MAHFTHRLIALLSLLCVAVTSFSRVWTADDIPMVHLEDKSRYVCDPERLLSDTVRATADKYFGRLERDCGIQSVLVVVGQVKGADCFRMAQDLGNKYGVGDKETRRGLVIVIAVDDRRYFIAPGKGLEADLTDVECDDIARACIVKNMRQNDIDDAVLSTARVLWNKFKTGKTGIKSIDEPQDDGGAFLVFVVLLLCFGLPLVAFVRYILESLGIVKKRKNTHRRGNNDDWFPPFIIGGGGFSGGGGISGGSFGGGSFGGGGAGGGW